MAMILTDSSNYSAIAEAIREKTGTEDTYKPSEMAAAIEAIQGGGEDNTFLEGGITEYSNSIITKIRDYGFYNYSTLESVSLPNVTTVGTGCFHSCKALTNVNLPSLITLGDSTLEASTFFSCDALTNVNLPKATNIGKYSFYGCDALTNIELPEVTTVGERAFAYCDTLTTISLPSLVTIDVSSPFYGCDALTTINLPNLTAATAKYSFGDSDALTTLDLPSMTNVEPYAFYNLKWFRHLILRKNRVCSVDTSAYTGITSIVFAPNSTYDRYIYVPRSLVSSYQSSPMWSEHAENIRAIEDYPDICG